MLSAFVLNWDCTGLKLPSACLRKLLRVWSFSCTCGIGCHSKDVSTAVNDSCEPEEKTSKQSSPGCAGWAPPETRGKSLPRLIGRLSYKVATNQIRALGYYIKQYVMYQKTQSTDIGNSLYFEEEEFDFWAWWKSFYTFSFIGAEQETRIDDIIFAWLRTFSWIQISLSSQKSTLFSMRWRLCSRNAESAHHHGWRSPPKSLATVQMAFVC